MEKTAVALRTRQVQMNTRIDARLKKAGDAVLQRLGYSPSAAVRGLWQFVIDNQDDEAVVRAVIDTDAASARSDGRKRKAAATAALRALYQKTASDAGISDVAATDLPSWDDLRDSWYHERLDRDA